MQTDNLFTLLSDISETEAFKNLQSEVKNFDWNEDVCLSLNSMEDTVAFKDCYIIQFLGSPLMVKIRPEFNTKPYTAKTKNLIKTIEKMLNSFLQQYTDHYLLKAHVVALKPGGAQIKHIDGHFYHYRARRIALPITTNNSCVTYIDDEIIQLREGKFYEMNNVVPHYSENRGNTLRVYLFLDLVPMKNVAAIYQFYHTSKLEPFGVEFPK